MGLGWSIVPRRRDFQLVDSENSWLLLSACSQSVSGTHSAQLTLEIPRISDWKPFSFPTKRSLRVHTVDLKAETIWGDAMSYPPILRKMFGFMVHGLLDMGGWGDLVEIKIERRNAKKKPGLQLKKQVLPQWLSVMRLLWTCEFDDDDLEEAPKRVE